MNKNSTKTISVEIQNIFPIIKKWLYSEKEIFLREIVSNASDAVTKLKRLESLGQAQVQEDNYRIDVAFSKENRTITVSDNGIGMTEEELSRYICQIALSGALEFIEKYEGEDNTDGAQNGIIGHFGLGFYSSFMVSDTVEVITKSYTDAPAVRWLCNESGEYEIFTENIDRSRGTSVIMHINDENMEYLSEDKLREILNRFCAFMPIEIYLINEDADEETESNSDDKKENLPVNDVNPLWLKNPSDCTDEDYKNFYHKVFADYKEPLFHIHINADYPLNFKGILYFPRITNEYESIEGQVKLYYNQVFVADNIKEVIPEYLLMLKGVLDCPDLPLNVSRSYLQNSGYVSKISAHIVKKVADKINALYNTDRENFEKIWRDIKTFVEYGCLRDRKFFDKVKNSVLYELTSGTFKTLPEYLETAAEKNKDKVYYTSDKALQSRYISMFDAEGIEVVILDKVIDTQFIHAVESTSDGVKFIRVDADIADALKGDGNAAENEDLTALFKEVSGNEQLKVVYENLRATDIPAILNISEEGRRMEDMMKLYSMAGMSGMTETSFVVNMSNMLIHRLITLLANGEKEKSRKIASIVYSLSLIAQRQLTPEELEKFTRESMEVLTEF